MKLLRITSLLTICLIFFSCSSQIATKDYVLEGTVFGTTYKIVYLEGKKNYQPEINQLFNAINASLSTYIPTSDISKINQGDTSISVDSYFEEVFYKSKKIYKETDGYFDPTVGNLVNAWGFGPKNTKVDLTKQQVADQMRFVGLDKVSLVEGKIKKQFPEIYFDFNSIAKGYGIDVIARFLEQEKIANYLVEIGGEIRVKGNKKDGSLWAIKVVDPVKSDTNSGFKNITLKNKSMATSGNYRKYRYSKTGEKYVHTINPKTGFAYESNLLSVSVIASLDCADVDAYATAFMAMGLEKTKNFVLKNPHLDVILIYADTNGAINEYTTYTHF